MYKLAELFNTLITVGLERFNLYYSEYRGIVVDNKDPENLHRVKLQVPQVFGQYTLDYWAWPKNIRANKDEGFQMLPKKNEIVWVSFEHGNPRRPVWSYGYRGDGDYIDEELTDPNIVWFKTRAGHKIVVDDTNELIRII